MTIGQRVKAARLEAGLTQQQLATDAGITIPTLLNIEKEREVNLSSLTKVLKALGLEVDFVEHEQKAG